MVRIELVGIVLIFVGIFVVGIIFFIFVARASGIFGKKVDPRKDFFKEVEDAREAQNLEKNPISYDVTGTWKGEGDGYFGIGRDLVIDLNQEQSIINGRLTDQFGYSDFSGMYIWPYLWFEFDRHGTSFEFRGVIKEIPGGSTIKGKYRYFHEDANWSVTLMTSQKSVYIESPSGKYRATTASISLMKEAVEQSNQQTPSMFSDELTESGRFKADPNKCEDCGGEIEQIYSFCLYCGTKKE